jgi:hypothetical protein
VDYQKPLAGFARVTTEVKLLVLRGSLDDALRQARGTRHTAPTRRVP